MELEVKPKRIKQLLRLKNLGITEVEKMMLEVAKRQRVGKTFGIEGYLRDKPICKMPYNVALALSEVLQIPVGFFYYNKVHIKVENNTVTVIVDETDETVSFPFC